MKKDILAMAMQATNKIEKKEILKNINNRKRKIIITRLINTFEYFASEGMKVGMYSKIIKKNKEKIINWKTKESSEKLVIW